MQEYQAIGQEVQELELTERSQVLPQDVSIAHDILAQDVHVFHVYATRSSTREDDNERNSNSNNIHFIC